MVRVPRDDYYVLMWNAVEPIFTSGPEKARLAIQRFRELGSNGGTCIATFINPETYRRSLEQFSLPPVTTFTLHDLGSSPFLENEFPFYVMNICRPLYWEWGAAKPLFRRQYETFARERDRGVFVRVPCVNNPAVMATMKARVKDIMDGLRETRRLSLLYDLRDEPSITSFLLASDSCFCEHCLSRMREWLREQYGDLSALNAEWDTTFSGWDEVDPMTTQEALQRREAGNWNFAPWADHRAFMNHTFARVSREIVEEIHRYDPEALAGLTGTQCPAVFGGYDFSRIVPVTDWVEAYDFGGAVDCYRSFKPRRRFPMLKTSGLGGGLSAAGVMLWVYVYQSGGYGGTIIWNSSTMLDTKSEELKPAAGTEGFADLFAELRSGIPRLLQRSDEINSPVAVHYSQASLNADFITSVANRPLSIAGFENGRSMAHQCREAWWKLLEDRGLRPVFIASGQIEAGDLARKGIRVLVLPRSIALSDAEAAAMRSFVEEGGLLLADSFAGRMDEHCREREVGVLDDLFGIRRSAQDAYHSSSQRATFRLDVKPGERPRWGGGPVRVELAAIEERIEAVGEVKVMGATEMTDAPVGIVAARGKGLAALLNAAPLEYLTARRSVGGGKGLQEFFGGMLELAGVGPEALVFDAASGRPMRGWRVWPFALGEARYFALAPDMEVAQDTLGAISGAAAEGDGRPVRVELAAAGHLYEAHSGRYLGEGRSLEDTFGPTSCPVYAVLPYRVTGLDLVFSGGVAGARVRVAGGKAAGEHVFRFDVFDAQGRRLLDRGANVVAPGGAGEWRPEEPLPAGGRLVCRDVATGARAEVSGT